MTATYRLVHYSPDPFTGARVPLGAVVVGHDGKVRVARAEHLPLACIGDRVHQLALLHMSERLDTIRQPDQLPRSFGPYTTLGGPQPVPEGVADPLGWVASMLNPPRSAKAAQHVVRGSTRGTYGYSFFQTWRVSQFVRKTFQPGKDLDGWLTSRSTALPSLTHWVKGSGQVLLMEPVVPTRRQFQHDLREVAERLAMYRPLLPTGAADRRGALVAYVTAGGPEERRAEAVEALRPYADDVIDVDVEGDRMAFIDRIRDVGRSGEGQGRLGWE